MTVQTKTTRLAQVLLLCLALGGLASCLGGGGGSSGGGTGAPPPEMRIVPSNANGSVVVSANAGGGFAWAIGRGADAAAAERAALAACRRQGGGACEEELAFQNACAAVAIGGGRIGWAQAATRAEAERAAIAGCARGAPGANCAVARGESDRRASACFGTAGTDEGVSGKFAPAGRPPETRGRIPDLTAFLDDTKYTVDAGRNFADPEGGVLTWAASSSNESVATVSLSGARITVSLHAVGTATVRVTATDPEGLSAAQEFTVRVLEAGADTGPPAVKAVIPTQIVAVDETKTLDLAAYFVDPDGGPLTYSAASGDEDIVTVAVSGGTLTLRVEARGAATVRVTATDAEGLSVAQDFIVKSPNRPPTAQREIAARTLVAGASETIDLSPHFADPDGDTLTYAAASSDEDAATVSVSGNRLTVRAARAGAATVRVTATDPERLSATLEFAVRVNAPPTTASCPDTTLHAAARAGDAGAVSALLACGRDPNVKDSDDGQTALHIASFFQGRNAVVRALLAHARTNVNILDNDGDAPLHLAAEYADSRTTADTAKILLADARTDPNIKESDDGQTALHIASFFQGRNAVVRALLAHARTNVNILDNDGDTPLDEALDGGNTAAAAILRGAGGRPSPSS